MVTHIIFDLNRTLYDPETDALVPDAIAVLDACTRRGIRLSLVSRRELGREGIIGRFALAAYFADLSLVSEKTPEIFADVIKRSGVSAHETLVVGDHPEDIRCGNACGVRTIRVRTGKFKDYDTDAAATYDVHSLEHVMQLI